MKDFGTLLKVLRKKATLTQRELADKLGIDSTSISKWERGKSLPDISILPRIADILNVSCEELLHPTETLEKMGRLPDSNTPHDCNDQATISANESEAQSNSEVVTITQKRKLFTPKRILLVCIPLIILAISIFVYIYTYSDFTFVEARTNVESHYGPAYELIYYHKTKPPTHVFIEHADNLLESWENGAYSDSTESVLIISYYPPDANIYDWEDAYFQMYYFAE